MKKSIKIISAIIAFVFTIEQIAYPAPYSALRAPASKNAESKDDFPRTLEEDPPIIKYLSETPPKEQVERLEKILKHHQPLTAAQEAEIKKLINIWKAAISEDQVGEASPDEAFPSGAFNRVRFAWYPTGEFDLKTAHELLKIFPDLSEFVYVDLYQHLTEKAFLREVGTQIEKHNLDFKIKNCRAEGPLTSEGGLDTD